MRALPLRLLPGQDLRRELEAALARNGVGDYGGAFVLSGIGSLSVARIVGGHVGCGCIVLTTAEVLLAVLDEWRLERQADASTGFDELAIRPSPTAS